MNIVRMERPILMAVLLAVFACGRNALTVEQQATEAATYPETADGLKALLQEWLAALKSGDTAKSDAIVKGFTIPDHATWFAKTFGYVDGPSLEVAYSQLQSEGWDRLKIAGFLSIEADRLVVKVSVFAKPGDTQNTLLRAALTAEKLPATFYCAEAVKSANETSSSKIGCYVYLDGGFRFLDQGALQALSTAPRTGTKQIRLVREGQGPKLTQRVPPVYLDEAKKNKVEGIVRLYVAIQKDGTVGEVHVMDGDPRLAPAAVSAVKLWHYEPVTVNGNAVDVRILVEVPFQLDH